MHMALLRRFPAAGLRTAALLLALAASACGDGDQAARTSTDGAPTAQATAPGPTAPSAGQPTAPGPAEGQPTRPSLEPIPDHTLPGRSPLPADGDVDLVLRVGSGGTPDEHSLSCTADGTAGGDHPGPDAACADLYQALSAGNPLAPVPADAICTQQYGGPETAELVGTVGDTQVSASFSLTDGCEIARWQALGAVLSPFAGGALG